MPMLMALWRAKLFQSRLRNRVKNGGSLISYPSLFIISCSQPVKASTGILQVIIKEVAGRRLIDTLPVDIKKVNSRLLYSNELPVEVKE